jgi:uncharacterized protein
MKRWLIGCLIGIIAAISVLIIYGVFIEPYQIEIHHVWIRDPDLGKYLDKKTVIQLSDLHIEDIGKREQKILKILDDLKPDIIFLTGDYVKWKGNYEAALTFLSRLRAKIGIWGVLGDYDYSCSRMSCLFCHVEGSGEFTKNHQVHFLRNITEMVHLPQGPIWISGIEKEEINTSSILKSLQFLKNKKPVIILSHNPLSFELLDKDHNIFMLAGDTHGGQIPLPFSPWLLRLAGYEKNASYSQGYFKNGNAKMYVSRGIGTSHIPIRLFRKPEIVVLHFSAN